jgi:hypothetical protein
MVMLLVTYIAAPVLAGAFLDGLVWWAALEIGRTRQFLVSLFLMEALFAGLLVASRYPWGEDLDIAAVLGLGMLGLPSSAVVLLMGPLVAFLQPKAKSGGWDLLLALIVLGGSAPLQAFVILPRFARWKQARASLRKSLSTGTSPYEAIYAKGSEVRVADRALLEEFARTWRWHHPLYSEQLAFAGRAATVEWVGSYHGGDQLYQLNGIPGIWHPQCLRPV